jgi:hypothetical protein
MDRRSGQVGLRGKEGSWAIRVNRSCAPATAFSRRDSRARWYCEARDFEARDSDGFDRGRNARASS